MNKSPHMWHFKSEMIPFVNAIILSYIATRICCYDKAPSSAASSFISLVTMFKQVSLTLIECTHDNTLAHEQDLHYDNVGRWI